MKALAAFPQSCPVITPQSGRALRLAPCPCRSSLALAREMVNDRLQKLLQPPQGPGPQTPSPKLNPSPATIVVGPGAAQGWRRGGGLNPRPHSCA
ncbi:MAG TPA: hypothetical protein VLS96_19450 [Nodosilinea sp.]|nr:hypothetical protein [Nodosilinea sp.]